MSLSKEERERYFAEWAVKAGLGWHNRSDLREMWNSARKGDLDAKDKEIEELKAEITTLMSKEHTNWLCRDHHD